MGSIDDVPHSFMLQKRREWWKYEIPYYFRAIKPSEIDEWDTDTILIHLAAVKDFKQREDDHQKALMNAFSGKRR